jgi:hypothetical protein
VEALVTAESLSETTPEFDEKNKTPAIAGRGCSPFGVEPAAPCGWDSIAAAGRVDSTEPPLALG